MSKKQMTTVRLEEQETTINVDYFARIVSVFTSKKSTYNKWYKDIGKPTNFSKEKGKIVGGIWRIAFEDRAKIRKILSISNII